MDSSGDADADADASDVASDGGGRQALLQLAKGSTALFVVVQVVAVLVPRGVPLAMSVLVALAFFLLGCLAFLAGFGAAVGRSRDEQITLGGLVFLSGTAPDRVRRVLIGCLTAQVVVSVATAAVRPFTPVAFGILVPMWGVGLMTSWGGRYGDFALAAPAREGAGTTEPSTGPTRGAGKPGASPVTDPGSPSDRAKDSRARPDPLEEIDDFDRLFSGRRRRRRSGPE